MECPLDFIYSLNLESELTAFGLFLCQFEDQEPLSRTSSTLAALASDVDGFLDSDFEYLIDFNCPRLLTIAVDPSRTKLTKHLTNAQK